MNNKKWILGKRDGQKPKKSSFHKMAIKHLEWILGDIAIILGLCLLKNQDGENKNNTVALLCQSYLKTYYLSIEADTILRLMSDPDVPIPKKDLGTIIKGLKNFIPLLNYYKKKETVLFKDVVVVFDNPLDPLLKNLKKTIKSISE